MNTKTKLPTIQLPWSQINTIFLDMDGTLLDLHFDNYFWLEFIPHCYAKANELSLDNAKQYLTAQTQRVEGQLEWYSLDYWSEQLALDIAALKHKVSHKIAVRGKSIAFLQWLKQSEKRIVLLTNAQPQTIAIKFNYVNLAPYFDSIISAHDIGLAKEEKGFWQKLSQVENIEPDCNLLIDDNLSVLNAAQDYGIRHLLSIRQPDSQKIPNTTSGYTAIECFSQLMISDCTFV